ncbi:hypothetical protein Pfo_000676 [Paulownia fortunei]|nr:hypothetical protein Pfo_000676 [Paulownia fortunei]
MNKGVAKEVELVTVEGPHCRGWTQKFFPAIACLSFYKSNGPNNFSISGLKFSSHCLLELLYILDYAWEAVEAESPFAEGGHRRWRTSSFFDLYKSHIWHNLLCSLASS